MSEMTDGRPQDTLTARARAWLAEDPDEHTSAELQALLDANDEAGLADRFLAKLEFGTAGLRGVLGAGPNRMNRMVVLRTTAGLGAYLLAKLPAGEAASKGVVIGYDGRRMSREFAEDAASVCAGLGLKAVLFPHVVPTPTLAYAVTALGAAAGIMVTASHNPPEYNGYKVYWSNGAQIIPPHDAGIAAAIDAVGPLVGIARPILKEARARGLVHDAPADLEDRYLDAVKALMLHGPDASGGGDVSVVYTAMHGVGDKLARRALANAGFTKVWSVPAQQEPDGAFPTVRFPNPEEPGALDLSYKLADEVGADLILANDPDADRLAVAARDEQGRMVMFTGNEIGVLLGYYLLTEEKNPGDNRLVVNSIVSSPMLSAIAHSLPGVRHEEVLTGFKWIANRALELEKSHGARFVFGYEEALGYSVGTVARDKDGVSAAAVFAEMARYYGRVHGRSALQQLDELYRTYGVFVSGQHNVTAKGLDGAARIKAIMEAFRSSHPERIGELAVRTVTDMELGQRFAPGKASEHEKLTLPPSNVIAYALEDGSRITIRPSGTEPKIKYYFDVREPVREGESVRDARVRAMARMDALKHAFVALADSK